MSRVATQNRTRRINQRISDHTGDPKRKYRVPPGAGVRRQLLRRTPKHIASRYYQLLSGHAAIGSYLKDKIRKIDNDSCWWCGGVKRQTRHHLFTECKAWMPQTRKLWKDIGRAHGWRHPRAPSGKWLWKEKSTEAVLTFLKSTRVGCINTKRVPPEEHVEDQAENEKEEVQGMESREEEEGEEGGPGPPGG